MLDKISISFQMTSLGERIFRIWNKAAETFNFDPAEIKIDYLWNFNEKEMTL
jgi:hypothetical protein